MHRKYSGVFCRWLDRNEDDGQIVRELVPRSDGQRLYSKSLASVLVTLCMLRLSSLYVDAHETCLCLSDVNYHVAVKTGNIPGGSSDSHVFVKLYGDQGDTSKMMLVVSDNNLGNYFEMGRVDIFTVDTSDIGQVTQSKTNDPGLMGENQLKTEQFSLLFLNTDKPFVDRPQQCGYAGRLVFGQRSDHGACPWTTLYVPQSPLALQRRG